MKNPRILSIKKEDNKEYFAILDAQNTLMEEWNRINKELHNLKIPKIFTFRNKSRLAQLGKDLQKLQKEFIDWEHTAYTFIVNPHLIFPIDAETEIGFLHYTSILRDLRNKLDSLMVLIAENYNRVKDWHSTQTNFIIAIASFLLTFLGLLATLFTMNNKPPEPSDNVSRSHYENNLSLSIQSSNQQEKNAGYILERESDIGVEQPGPHEGGGTTTGYSFFANVPDYKLVFRKRVLHPGSAIGYHLQERDEIYYIVSGTGEMSMNGKTFTVKAGDAILTRPGSSHGLKPLGKTDLALIVAYEQE